MQVNSLSLACHAVALAKAGGERGGETVTEGTEVDGASGLRKVERVKGVCYTFLI